MHLDNLLVWIETVVALNIRVRSKSNEKYAPKE